MSAASALPARIALTALTVGLLAFPAASSAASRRLDAGGGAGFWTRARIRQALTNDSLEHRPVASPGGAAASSLRVLDASAPEDRSNGRIFGYDPREGPYSCSGTSLSTPSGSIVLTAGHCVVENHSWGTHLVFIPAYDHERRPFGTFVATQAFVMTRWRRVDNSAFDVAALKVRRDAFGTLATVVGSKGWTSSRSRYAEFQIFGYPAGALGGEELRSCVGYGLGSDKVPNPLGGPAPVPARCDMAGGSSGGAWLTEGGQLIDGVTSYGYPRASNRLFSPYFGTAVAAFLRHLP